MPCTAIELYKKHSTTIQGLISNGCPRDTTIEFFNYVYNNLDLSKLRKYTTILDTATGYTSDNIDAFQALYHLKCPIVIASNSPSYHIKRVLSRLGLGTLPIACVLTPERCNGYMKTERQFWDPLLKLYPTHKYSCCLIDDNTRNIQAFRKLGYTRTLHINRHFRLPEALVYFLNILPTTLFPTSVMSPRDVSLLNKQAFKFDSTRYLHYKNDIDRASFNIHAKKRLIYELNNDYNKHAITQNVEHTYTVVDIGAGIMNMFIEVLDILSRARESNTRPSLDSPADTQTAIPLVYIAYESNTELNHAIVGKLNTLGLRVVNDTSTTTSQVAYTFKGSKTVNNIMFDITVYVLNIDFTSQEAIDFIKSPPLSPHISHTTPPHIDLIVGCCVADLVDPRTLVTQLLEFNSDGGGLVYLPITFTGTTRLHRPSRVMSEADADAVVASDERVFELYRQHLLARGHHIGVSKLLETITRSSSLILPPLSDNGPSSIVGIGSGRSGVTGGTSGDEDGEVIDIESSAVYGKYIAESASNWRISPRDHPYMWSCMMRFIALGVILPSIGHNSEPLDLTAWFLSIHEAMQADASSVSDNLELIAENVDIVIRLPLIHQHVAKAIPYKGRNSDSSAAIEAGVDEYYRAASVDELAQPLKYQCQADESDEHIAEFNIRLLHSSSLTNTIPSSQKVSKDDLTAINDQSCVSTTPPLALAPTIDLTRTYEPNSTIATQMVEFLRPHYAHIITESLTTSTLTPDQLLLESEVSLISTGTELKMYAGDVDTAQPTDLTIGGLKDSTLAYPMKYGLV